jgi:uncharacterized protein (TIGR02246 family)
LKTLKRVLVSLSVVVLLAVAASGQTKSQTAAANEGAAALLAEARRAIDKGNAQWIEGWEKGDPALVAAIFTEDGTLLARNGKVIKGRQQILERQKAAMQYVGQGVKVTVTTVDVWVDGDTAYETGKYLYRYQENGKPATDEGRYVTIWKRQKEGSWKLSMDMVVPQD